MSSLALRLDSTADAVGTRPPASRPPDHLAREQITNKQRVWCRLKKGRLGADGDVEFYDEQADDIIAKDEEKKREHEAMTERIKQSLAKEKS
jgi:hypothetical protein